MRPWTGRTASLQSDRTLEEFRPHDPARAEKVLNLFDERVDMLKEKCMPGPDAGTAKAEQQSLAIFALIVGAVQLARAVDYPTESWLAASTQRSHLEPAQARIEPRTRQPNLRGAETDAAGFSLSVLAQIPRPSSASITIGHRRMCQIRCCTAKCASAVSRHGRKNLAAGPQEHCGSVARTLRIGRKNVAD